MQVSSRIMFLQFSSDMNSAGQRIDNGYRHHHLSGAHQRNTYTIQNQAHDSACITAALGALQLVLGWDPLGRKINTSLQTDLFYKTTLAVTHSSPFMEGLYLAFYAGMPCADTHSLKFPAAPCQESLLEDHPVLMKRGDAPDRIKERNITASR